VERRVVVGERVARVAEPLHHPQEQLGVRAALGEAARLLLVEVLGQRPPHVGHVRHLPERAREQYGEVAHVHEILVAKVLEELRTRQARTRERRVRPVVFLVHDREEAVLQRRRRVHAEIVTGRRAPVTFSTD
jgi:hypothetical protein